jgi:cobalamin-dependent methionine synthase I
MDQFRIMSRHQFQIGNEEFHVGPEIYRRLKDATSLVLFAVTAGPGPENLARELMSQGAYLEGYIADLIGTAIVEWAAEQLHQKVKAQAGFKGWKVTNRYSPGYCSWNVAEQQKLFHLIPPELCGIELSESSLMTPVKSVSGIIGAGNQVTFHANSCSHCPMKECAFRRSN